MKYPKLTQKIEELVELGLNEDQINEVWRIAEEEALDVILESLIENFDSKEVKQYAEKFEQYKSNRKEIEKLRDEIIGKIYGNELIETKKEDLFISSIDNIQKLILDGKEILQKYEMNDKQTVKQVKKGLCNPDVQDLTKRLIENNKNN